MAYPPHVETLHEYPTLPQPTALVFAQKLMSGVLVMNSMAPFTAKVSSTHDEASTHEFAKLCTQVKPKFDTLLSVGLSPEVHFVC